MTVDACHKAGIILECTEGCRFAVVTSKTLALVAVTCCTQHSPAGHVQEYILWVEKDFWWQTCVSEGTSFAAHPRLVN